MNAPTFRTPYSHSAEEAAAISQATGLDCKDPSLAVQSEKDEADINILLQRFGITGQLPVNVRPVFNGDFTEVFDYQTAMNVIAEANQAFGRMPANIRARFQNDPAEFVDFCSDPENLPEMVRLGLAERKPDPVSPPAAPAPTGGTVVAATTPTTT